MSGLEAADINDDQILNATRQNSNPKNGAIQFEYTFPDGHVLTSEWIAPDNRRRALFAWVEAVRSQMVDHAQQTAARKSRPKIHIPEDEVPPLKPRKPEPAPVVEQWEEDETVEEAVPVPRRPVPVPARRVQQLKRPTQPVRAESDSNDPLQFARQQLAIAEQRADQWRLIIEQLEQGETE